MAPNCSGALDRKEKPPHFHTFLPGPKDRTCAPVPLVWPVASGS